MNLEKNAFAHLHDITECFYCHIFGHNTYEFHLRYNRLSSQNNYRTYGCIQWRKRKEEKKDDKCDLVLYAQGQNNKRYVESSFSRHMTGDKSKLVYLDESKTGNFTFGNNEVRRFRGYGIVSLNNGRGNA